MGAVIRRRVASVMSTCCYVPSDMLQCYTSSGPGSGSPYPATLPSDELLRCPHDPMNAESVERRGSEGREGCQ